MKAQETNLLKFLRTPAQYMIPVYQRTYSWEIAQCQQLWRDIVRAGKDAHASGHFIGSVVYIAKGIYSTSSVPQLLVIDGQQRLTTLTLLLTALGRAIGQADADIGITSKKLASYYLFNDLESDDLRYKLLLTRSDKVTLTHLLNGKEPPETPSHRLLENFRLFEELLRRNSGDWEAVWEGIQKLVIVDISLDRDHDNPQLIFESLNATGLKLSQADLIRNYILMGLEPQEQKRLYEDYWFPMEREFGHAEYAERFDGFMRDYLTVKTGRISNLRDVYADFKARAQAEEGASSLAEIVADVYRFSRYYVRIALHKDPDAILNRHFVDINTLRMEVAYPFLVEVYQDYEKEHINRDEFAKILSLVESYVFRRAICGIPPNSLNKTFAGLSREVKKGDYEVKNGDYVDSLQAALLAKDSYRRFPNDDEFKREFMVKDVYNFRSRNYYLAKLENYGRKETVSVDAYTIEHILPQNPLLRPEWQAALGADWKAVQSRLLHTLGNLTLTGYNPELSDRPFQEKRDMEGGFRDSPLRLNKGLGQLDTWGEAEIAQRADRLALKAVTVWPCPVLSPAALAKYQEPAPAEESAPYTLADHAENLQGDILELFQEFRKRVLNLDASVREEVKKMYIAYKNTTNFVDVIPQKKRLRLSLNMRFDEIDDPKGLCRNITDIGRWGNGDVETGIISMDQMADVMALVRQSFDKHSEDAD